MSKVKSPTAIKTEKAHRIDAKNAVEMAHIKAIGDGMTGRLPKSVIEAVQDSHNRVNAQRQECVAKLMPSVGLLLKGNHSTDIIRSITLLCNEMQPPINW